MHACSPRFVDTRHTPSVNPVHLGPDLGGAGQLKMLTLWSLVSPVKLRELGPPLPAHLP